MIKNIFNPTAEESLSFIEKHHKSKPDKTILLLVGDCMVDYRGRARSLLDWGERMVMIKEDGTVLVHQPVMREPVNWQPVGSKTEFKINKDKQLVMRSRHNRPPEKMKITFRKIKSIIVSKLRDKATLVISGMETDVVNQIITDPKIIEDGLRINKREKHVKSGLIDLYGFDKDHVPVVIEVKRSIANISAVQQLRMYVNDVKKDVKKANVRGILCAPRIPDMVKKLLSDYGLEWHEVERQVILPDDWQTTLKDF
ncbi:MAG: endonuclease NucS [Thermoplasmatales archaeon]|nr:MAG: endonuclease NucS [Thermoplasmatales archaeon]